MSKVVEEGWRENIRFKSVFITDTIVVRMGKNDMELISVDVNLFLKMEQNSIIFVWKRCSVDRVLNLYTSC